MDILRIETADDPFRSRDLGREASVLLGRAETMGFLQGFGTITRLDVHLLRVVLQRLGRAGLVQATIPEEESFAGHADPASLFRVLRGANVALEDSPIPGQEWTSLRETLGDALLAKLCRISEVSLRRYASGARVTPDLIALRLHAVALIVADLRGAYNDYGVRRWFERSRTLLGGKSPVAYLPPLWDADSRELADIRALAASLTASPAT